MVILGLGANIFDRLKQLRHAAQLLENLSGLSVKQYSPLYISDALLPENAPESWNVPYINLALRCETTLKPLELLEKIKEIEKKVGRTKEKIWGPRVIDIDILAWDDLVLYDERLHIPHEHLALRPFALWPLADVAPRWRYPLPGPLLGKTAVELTAPWGSRFDGKAPLGTKQIAHRIDTPSLVGVLNVTPDSCSQDGVLETSLAFQHAENLISHGAEIIDIGAESTSPSATPIDAETEWQRLAPVLKIILENKNAFLIPPKISVDTRHVTTAEKILNLGVDWINDVSGLENPDMISLLRNQNQQIIFMHHLGIPVSKQSGVLPIDQDPVPFVFEWAEKKLISLEKLGIDLDRLIFDVGIGFGKTHSQCLELIKNISFFKKLGVKMLVGHSRKVFLTQFTHYDYPERDLETNVVSLFLANQSVDYLRVHNVESCSRSLKVAKALAN